MRVLPTNKPIFLDPNKAGEGFPFDYNQNTSVYINTPLFISHISLDKKWAFVTTNFASGWIEIENITLLDTKKRNIFKNNNYAIAIKDNFPIYNAKKEFLETIKLGTLFPIYKDKLIFVSRESLVKNKLLLISNQNIQKKPLLFKKQNLKQTLQELQNEPYGWGGLFNTRDCSSMTRDIFSLYGVYLKRNSASQKKGGKYTSITNLSNSNKKEFILKQAKPFSTLLYMKGHVMLYVGHHNFEPIVFHQVWGVKTTTDNIPGRFIIGKTVFSTLEPGKELRSFDQENSLLKKIEGIIEL